MNRLIGHEQTFTQDGAINMLFGEVGQTLIQRLFPVEHCEFSIEGEIPLHIDIFEDLKYPIEIKWSAQKIYRSSDIPEGWIKQLMGYMALSNSMLGWMLIINLGTRQINAFKFLMTEKEIEDTYREIYESKERILEAVKTNNDSKLKLMEEECYWCSYKATKEKRETGEFICPRYISKKRSVNQPHAEVESIADRLRDI